VPWIVLKAIITPAWAGREVYCQTAAFLQPHALAGLLFSGMALDESLVQMRSFNVNNSSIFGSVVLKK
jgi:hypothetical protein